MRRKIEKRERLLPRYYGVRVRAIPSRLCVDGQDMAQMQRVLTLGVVITVALLLLTLTPSARQAPTAVGYETRCAGCHGADMAGATGPAIVQYVRYHTDAEISRVVRDGRPGMPALRVADDELRQILARLRAVAGTNPAMATGGYTGSRGAGAGDDGGAAATGRGGA